MAPIARGGKVYRIAAEPLQRPPGQALTVRLEGIRRASTFWGFCTLHDAEIFRTLDGGSFPATQQEAALLLYRAIVHELAKKQWALDVLASVEAASPGDPVNRSMKVGSAWSVLALMEHLERLEHVLLTSAFGEIECEVFESSSAAAVVGSSVWFPDFDFEGVRLQAIPTADHVPGLVGIFALPSERGSTITVAWHRDSAWCVGRFLKSLASAPQAAEVGDRLFRMVLLTSENIYFRPEWWETLQGATRRQLIRQWNENTSIESEIDPKYLQALDELGILWAVDGVRSSRCAG